jgi:hypothetical protein
MIYRVLNRSDFEVMTIAINAWYRHFKLSANDRDTNILCAAALELFHLGNTQSEELAVGLLERFPSAELVKQNAVSSASVH